MRELRAQAEERLLQDGKLAFDRSDYPEAILLLSRFIKTHGYSVHVLEAQWWLAQSYEQLGNLHLGLDHFQRLAKSAYDHPYRREARLRAQFLIQTLGIGAISRKIHGVAIDLESLQNEKETALLVARFRQDKGAILMVNLGCPIQDLAKENNEPQGRKPTNWGNQVGQRLEPLVEDAYKAGQAVYLGVSLPCLGLFAEGEGDETLQWYDWVFEPRLQKVRTSPYFSVYSARYQAVVLDMLTKFSEFHIAGIVFQEDIPLGPYQGLSPVAIKRFEEKFETSLNVSTLFIQKVPFFKSQLRVENVQDSRSLSYPAVFWKWVGWKFRERLRVINGFMQSLRSRFPHLQFGTEIHLESLTNPVYALAMFSEDWVEVAQAPFDFFVANVTDSSLLRMHQNLSSKSRFPRQMVSRSLVEQMIDYLGEPQKVWVVKQKPLNSFLDKSQGSSYGNAQPEWPEGVGEIIDVSPVP